MFSRALRISSTRNERQSSSPPPQTHQPALPALSRSSSLQAELPVHTLDPKMSKYAQGKAEKRRASDSAYATKSAGYWAKTSEGREALERYEKETKRCKERQNQGLQSRTEFCQIELHSHSIAVQPQSPINGSNGYKERARRSMFAVGLEDFDRELFSSLKSHVSDSEILQREQRIEGRLANVKRQLEMDQRAFHEEVAKEFESGVRHHLRNFQRDIDQLIHCIFHLRQDMLDCAGGPTSEKATIMIMLAARRAYELDMILLIRYWFIKRTNEIRRAPIVEHNEKAIIQAFQFAETRAHRELTTDGLEHSCNAHCDDHHSSTRCPSCHIHALHLFEITNDRIHQNVLELGLYRIGDTPDTTASKLNAHYYFIAFACVIATLRQDLQLHENSHARQDARDRMFLLLNDLYKHYMEQRPLNVEKANEIYLRLKDTWLHVHHADIVKKMGELQQQTVDNANRNESSPHPSQLQFPPPQPTLHPRPASVSSVRQQTAAVASHDPPNNAQNGDQDHSAPSHSRNCQNSAPTPNRPRKITPSSRDIADPFNELPARRSPIRSRFRESIRTLPRIDTAPSSPVMSDDEDSHDSAYVTASPAMGDPFGGMRFFDNPPPLPSHVQNGGDSSGLVHSLNSVGEEREGERGRGVARVDWGRDIGRRSSTTTQEVNNLYSPSGEGLEEDRGRGRGVARGNWPWGREPGRRSSTTTQEINNLYSPRRRESRSVSVHRPSAA